MSASSELVGQVQALFLEKLHMKVPSQDTDLFEEGLLDSLQLVELVLLMEKEFGIEVPLEEVELESFRSVNSIAAYLAGRNVRQAGSEIE